MTLLDILAIEEAIAQGRAVPVTGTLSAAKSFIVQIPEGKFFHKQYQQRKKVKDATGGAQIEDKEKFNLAVYSLPATANIEIGIPLEAKVASEVMATLRWRSLGIPSQELVYYDGKFTIVFRYLNGYSLEKVLDGPDNPPQFSQVLDSFHAIRRKAKELKNPEILHSDPYANNFFYDQDRKIVIPFDSSKVNKNSMSFDEIDARLNLFFLSKIFHLKTDDKTRLGYLAQSADRLTTEERQAISAL